MLREVGEMLGGERIVMEGGGSEEVFDKRVGLMNDLKEYFMKEEERIYEKR